jgi:hypothetical protein
MGGHISPDSSPPKEFNGFQLNLILRVYTKSSEVNLFLVCIRIKPYIK